MNETAEIVDLGFSVADAEEPKIEYEEASLLLSFTDWKEERMKVRFHDVSAFRWQEAEYYVDQENERFDSCHIISNSNWLKTHEKQSELVAPSGSKHYKLNFNASGVFEIICTRIDNLTQPVSRGNES